MTSETNGARASGPDDALRGLSRNVARYGNLLTRIVLLVAGSRNAT